MFILLIGFILGVITVVSLQYFTLTWMFKLSPKYKPPRPPKYSPSSLPPVLSQKANGPFKEETCQWINFCGAFLFQELRESNLVKKAVITKLNEEFKEFLLKKTTGQLLHQVTVRDYFLGDSLPQVNSVNVLKVRRDEKEELLTEVTVGFDVDYKGAALIAIDADILLGKSFSVSVELIRLAGKVRLQFSREPYTHWSMSFMREPLIEIRVEPELQGRNVSQLITPIEKLIHRFIRKKHTLPNYKVRRSPLFPKLVPQSANIQLYMHDTALSEGILEVDILGCSRLLEIPEAKRAFCTAAITDKQWKPLNRLVRPANGPMLNLTIEKTHGMEHGISFQRYQDQEMELNCIVVSDVTASSPGYKAGVMKGDFVFFINGVEVKSVSKAKSLIETTPSGNFILTVQRFFSTHAANTGPVQVNAADPGTARQMTEFDPEISSLLGTFVHATEPTGWEEKDRLTPLINDKTDAQIDKESTSKAFPDDFPNTDLCPDQQQRTKYNYYSRHIPAFPDKFTFNIMPEHKFLSIVLWYDSPEITDAALAGHVTIPLCDIAVECVATSSGRHTQRYVLVPVNPLRPGMSKIHARQIASANDQVSKPWIAPGVANKQAQFAGDILLCFSHTPKYLKREDKPEYSPWSRHIALAKARQREKQRDSFIREEVQTKHTTNGISTHTDELESSYDALATDPETQTQESRHNFMPLTTFNAVDHDTCKICYGELKSELVTKCQNCSLVCHHRCSVNADQKIVCNERTKRRVAKTCPLDQHAPLESRLSYTAIEADAERVLLCIPSINGNTTEIVPDTNRYQEQTLANRLTLYREQILKLKHNLDTHEEVVRDLKHQLSSPCPPENLKPIKFQLSNTEDKQRAIATLLLQYCEGLKVLENLTATESGSEQDD